MSDKQIRSLSRQAAGGDIDAKVKLLQARTRSEVSTLTVACREAKWPKGNSECKDGKVSVHDGRIHGTRAGPSMAVIGEADCSVCNGTGSVRMEWPERLDLAAYCGDEACEILEGYTDPMLMDHISGICHCGWCEMEQGFPTWLTGITRRSQEASTRTAVAAARCALPVWEKPNSYHYETAFGLQKEFYYPRETIKAAEAWLKCPCEEHRKAWDLAGVLIGTADELWCPRPSKSGGRNVTGCLAAARLVGSEPPVREAIRKALIEWVLGDA